ncbi:MAG: alpha/beta hydrolase [Planctomycetota bacterium]
MPRLCIDFARRAAQHGAVIRSAVALCVVAMVCACTVQQRPNHPRPALPAHYPPVPVPEILELEAADCGRQLGVLAHGEERVRFEVRRHPRAAGEPPRPLVLLVPILAGGKELMGLVAEHVRGEGFDVAFCERAGSALSPPQRGPELDELFRRTVLHQRLLLAWLRAGDEPPPHVHVLGMSMGGIVTTVLAAHEPTIDSVAICLAGADLAGLVLVTSERRVHRWLDWRQDTDGIGSDSLYWEIRQFLEHEPARFAAQVPTEKVLFVSAAFDTVVPRRNQSLLWEGLGRPQRLDVPFGHYTAAVAVGQVIGAAAAHFRARQDR